MILVDVGVPPMEFSRGWCLLVKYVRFKSGLVEFYYASISFVWGLITLTSLFWWCTRATSACLGVSRWILRMASCMGGRVEATTGAG